MKKHGQHLSVTKPFIYKTLYVVMYCASQQTLANSNNELQQEIEQGIALQQKQQRVMQLEQHHRSHKKDSISPAEDVMLEKDISLYEKPSVSSCTKWHSVQLNGLSLLESYKQRELEVSAKQVSERNPCIMPEDIMFLSRQVTAAFLEEGYFKTKVTPSTIESLATSSTPVQKLILDFTPSVVTDINNNTEFSTFHLFGDFVGRPANIKDIDQGLDQANRLKYHKVSIDIYPKETGDVALVVSDEHEKNAWHGGKVHGEVSFDNLGDASINRARAQFQLGIIDPLGKADHLLLYGLSTLPAKDRVNKSISVYSKSFGINYDIPFGYWTFSLFGSLSQSNSQVQLNINRISQESKSSRVGGHLRKVISRGPTHIQAVNASYSYSDRKNKIGGAFIAAQSPKIKTYGLGANHTEIIKNGYISINANYKHDHVKEDKFNRVLMSVDTQRHFLGRKTGHKQFKPQPNNFFLQSWNIHSRIAGQYAAKPLPSGERSTVNNQFGVRGGFDYGVSGDSYLSMQNTLTFHTARELGNVSFSPYLGLDFARAFQKESRSSHRSQEVASVVLGAKTRIHDTELDIFASKASIDAKLPKQFSEQSLNRERKAISDAESIQVSAILKWHF